MRQLAASFLLFFAVPLAAQIPAGEYAMRRSGLAQIVKDGPVIVLGSDAPARDYELFFQNPNFNYLTGVGDPGASLVMLVRESKIASAVLFIVPPRSSSGHSAPFGDTTRRAGLPARSSRELKPYLDSLLAANTDTALHVIAPARAEAKPGSLVLYVDSLAASRALAVKFVPVSRLRGQKSLAELDLIRKAVHITGLAQQDAMRMLRPGMYEFEIQALVEYTFRRYGADRPGFASIIGSGPNTTVLHYNTNTRLMQDGDLVVMDIGASYRGYSADVTRTVPVNGTFTPAQREVYQAVLDAQAAGERRATPGARPDSTDTPNAVLADRLTKMGLMEGPRATYDCDVDTARQCSQLALYYWHGLGHPIGLDVHDMGRQTTTPFTIEPGIYVRENLLTEVIPDTPRNRAFIKKIRPAFRKYVNTGVRIEDDYVVTGQGLERLSLAPREIHEIEALMSTRATAPMPRDSEVVGWYQKTASQAPRPAQALIDEAVQTAKAQNKTVLVYFTASWCGWCKRFGAFLASPEVGPAIAEHYIVVSLVTLENGDKKVLENPGAAEIVKANGGEKSGIPFFFFLDGDGKVLANSIAAPSKREPGTLTNIGHPAMPEEIVAFDSLLRKTAPRMTETQRADIAAYLKKPMRKPASATTTPPARGGGAD